MYSHYMTSNGGRGAPCGWQHVAARHDRYLHALLSLTVRKLPSGQVSRALCWRHRWPLDEHPRLAAAKALGGRLPLLCVELHDGGGQEVADGRGSVMSSAG